MIVWMITVGALAMAMAWKAVESWRAVRRAEGRREAFHPGELTFDSDRAYQYDYQDFDDYDEDEL